MKPVFRNGKATLEECFNCGQSKRKVEYYRRRKAIEAERKRLKG